MSNQTSSGDDFVSLTPDIIDIGALTTRAQHDEAGAISTFLGTTRNTFEGKEVIYLEYEAYDSMALDAMRVLCGKMRAQWDLKHIVIQHKLGSCPVGHVSVFIAVSSAHRAAAIRACEFAINDLKASVPVWKKEVYASASSSAGAGGSEQGGHKWKVNSEFKPQVPLSLLRGAAAQRAAQEGRTDTLGVEKKTEKVEENKQGEEAAVAADARKRELIAQRLKEELRRSACDAVAGEGGQALLLQLDQLWAQDPLIDEIGVIMGVEPGTSMLLCSDASRNEHKLGIPVGAMKPLFAYSVQWFQDLYREWRRREEQELELRTQVKTQSAELGAETRSPIDGNGVEDSCTFMSHTTLVQSLFSATRAILVVRGDMPTALNTRKQLLLDYPSEEAVAAELCLVAALLTLHPKSPSAWQHRRWAVCLRFRLEQKKMKGEGVGAQVLDNATLVHNMWVDHVEDPCAAVVLFHSQQAQAELALVDLVNRRYAQNYYGWTHRLWVLHRLVGAGEEAGVVLPQLQRELEYAHQWLLTHTSDHCCANYWVQVVICLADYNSIRDASDSDSTNVCNTAVFASLCGHLEQSTSLVTKRPGSEALWSMRRSLLNVFLSRIAAQPVGEAAGGKGEGVAARGGEGASESKRLPAWLSVDGPPLNDTTDSANTETWAPIVAAVAAAAASAGNGGMYELTTALIRHELQFVRRCCTDISAWNFQQQRMLAIRYGAFCIFNVRRLLLSSSSSNPEPGPDHLSLCAQLGVAMNTAFARLTMEDAFERGWVQLGSLQKLD